MTNIEQKALALVRDVADGYEDVSIHHVHNAKALRSALCRAIEQHEAFRQEVSDRIEACRAAWPGSWAQFSDTLERFILPKPDPLVDALLETFPRANGAEGMAADLRAAIEARGGRIVWTGSGR